MRFGNVLVVAILMSPFTTRAGQQAPSPPPAGAYGESEFQLGPEDVIEVFVWKEPDLSTSVVVRPDGKISLPLIGELQAKGKTAVQLQDGITQRLKELVADPVVNVIVKEVNSAKVSVLGEVKNPGVYKIKDGATLLDAVALAGGFTEYAKRNKVTVIRSLPEGSKSFNLNVDDLIKNSGGDTAGGADLFFILPYDKVWVP